MSNTNENLAFAFASEPQANRNYLFFAEKAEAEGQERITRLFRAAAEAGKIPATRVVTIIHEGYYRKTSAIYKKLQSWINTNSLEVCGQAEEVYLTDINKTNGEQRIEIRLPVYISDISGR